MPPQIVLTHARYPNSCTGVTPEDEAADVATYRAESSGVPELLAICAQELGQAFTAALMARVRAADAWQDAEVALFALRCIAEPLRDSDSVLCAPEQLHSMRSEALQLLRIGAEGAEAAPPAFTASLCTAAQALAPVLALYARRDCSSGTNMAYETIDACLQVCIASIRSGINVTECAAAIDALCSSAASAVASEQTIRQLLLTLQVSSS